MLPGERRTRGYPWCMKRRIAAALLAMTLGSGAVAGCSSDAGNVSCNLNNCTVTLNQGVDADVSVLGAKVKLVSASNGQVVLEVGGNRVTLPVGDNQGTDIGGLNIRVSEVTNAKVTLVVTKTQEN